PIFDVLEKMSGKTYKSTLPNGIPASSGAAHGSFRGDAESLRGGAESLRGDAEPLRGDAEPLRGGAESSSGDAGRSGDAPQSPGNTAKTPENDQIAQDIAFRVIADHIRTLSFAIADGIQPGNNDRNYVLRRILRRAVRYGRTLGFKEPFFYKLVDVLADTMGDVFPEIRARKKQVQDVIHAEEEAFNKTLDKGIAIFDKHRMALEE